MATELAVGIHPPDERPVARRLDVHLPDDPWLFHDLPDHKRRIAACLPVPTRNEGVGGIPTDGNGEGRERKSCESRDLSPRAAELPCGDRERERAEQKIRR